MFFFVKVRVDKSKLADLGQKIQDGSLTTHPSITYCLKEDPSVGINIWEANDRAAFEKAFSPHRQFYSDVIEITPVITTQEAMRLLMQ